MKRRITQYFEQGVWYLIYRCKNLKFFVPGMLVILGGILFLIFIFISGGEPDKIIFNFLNESGTSIKDTVYSIGGQ
jgi:hypothetical protein